MEISACCLSPNRILRWRVDFWKICALCIIYCSFIMRKSLHHVQESGRTRQNRLLFKNKCFANSVKFLNYSLYVEEKPIPVPV
jgi:hypothetical protein